MKTETVTDEPNPHAPKKKIRVPRADTSDERTPSKEEILTVLSNEICMYRRSYADTDEKISDNGVLWTIANLRAAKKIISGIGAPNVAAILR